MPQYMERLSPEQHRIIKSKAKRLFIAGGRQGGKSYALELLIILECILRPGTQILYSAKADKQVLHIFREVLKHPMAAMRITQSNKSEKEIWFGESYVKFTSTREPLGIKGVPYDLVILDEIQDAWSPEDYDVVVPVLVAARRGRIIYSGQPRSVRAWYYPIYQRGLPKGVPDPYSGQEGLGDPDHETIVFPTPNGVRYKDEDGLKELALLKRSVDDLTWERDYLCNWIDISEANAFDPQDVKGCVRDAPRREPIRGELYCVGHDLGETKDRGVSKVIHVRTGDVVDGFTAPKWMKHRRPQADTDQVREVYKLAKRWNNAPVYVDGTGGGAPGSTNDYAKEYISLIPNCTPLYFLPNTKPDMVARLKFALERRQITIPAWDKNLINELLAYECISKGDRIIYRGSDGMHDDEVCALILANEGMMKQRRLAGAQNYTLGQHIRGNH